VAHIFTYMKARLFILSVVIVMAGCSHQDPQDPIDHLMAKLEKEMKTTEFTSYAFRPIDIPTNALPQQVITELSNRGYFQATNIEIVEMRKVQSPEDLPKKWYTAVLVNSSGGQRIALIRPMGSYGWYYQIYDDKSELIFTTLQ
jgi:hypothetical protein